MVVGALGTIPKGLAKRQGETWFGFMAYQPLEVILSQIHFNI